jgi:signal transduction histidine kinase
MRGQAMLGIEWRDADRLFGQTSRRLGHPLVRVTVAVGALAVWCVIALALPVAGSAHAWERSMAGYLAAELFLIAGLARLACWRMTHADGQLRAAITFAALGLAMPAVTILVPWTVDGTHVAQGAPLTRVIVFASILLQADRGWRIVSRGSVTPRMVAMVAVLFGPAAVLAVLGRVVGAPALSPGLLTAVSVVAELSLAAAWVALALGYVRRQKQLPAGITVDVPLAMVVMACGEFVRAASIHATGGMLSLGTGFSLVAGGLFAYAAVADSRAARGAEGHETRELVRALGDTRELLSRMEQAHRERLHDARSAVCGVIGASQLLAQPRPPMTADRDSLRRMIAAELARLQVVLDTETAEPIVDFDIAEVLAPVVLAHRIDDTTIENDVDHLWVNGRPGATATVLDNLLRNARTHAPGATITVRANTIGGLVVISVEDDGPGIPAAERAAVLLPGVRGSTAQGAGSGLGLHTCAQAMANQSGALHLASGYRGGTCVRITLPAAVGADRLCAMAS